LILAQFFALANLNLYAFETLF